MQLRLEGFDDLPRLTAGYTLDQLQLELAKMCITLQVGRRVEYIVDLNGDAGQQLIPFPVPRRIPRANRAYAPRSRLESLKME